MNWNKKPFMDLVMAQSIDGYFATGPNDDMTWTGKKDKQFFKLITSIGNTNLLSGLTTAESMPPLEYRRLWAVRSQQAGWIVNNGVLINEIKYSQIIHQKKGIFNGAKVIGGPKLAKSVIEDGYINYAYISIIKKKLNKGIGQELTELLNKFQYGSFYFDGLEIRKYRLKGEKI